MFLLPRLHMLVLGNGKGLDEVFACVVRIDDGIHPAVASGHVRIGKLVLVFFNLLLAHGYRVSGLLDFLAEDDVGCTYTKSAFMWREHMAM